MAIASTATTRLVRIPLVGLLGALLLVAGNDRIALPFLAAQRASAATEEEPPLRGDADDTSQEFNSVRGRPRTTRWPPHCHLRAPTQAAAIAQSSISTPVWGPLRLPPPPRERDRLNGVGAALRC